MRSTKQVALALKIATLARELYGLTKKQARGVAAFFELGQAVAMYKSLFGRRSPSRYMPHQGAKECARRVKQMERGIISRPR